MIQTMQSEREPGLTVEMDTNDHRKEDLVPGPGSRPRPTDGKKEEEARRTLWGEFRTKQITRPVTYDEILALIEAEIRALDEIQRRELFDAKRKDTARELSAIGEEITREFARTAEKTRELIVDATKEPNRRMETTTTTATTTGSYFHDSGNPPASVDGTAESSGVRGGCSEDVEGPAGTRDVSARGGTSRNVSFRENPSPGGASASAEATTSGPRTPQHRKHQMEELVIEDVDTFYEDQTKSPKKKKTKQTEQTRRDLRTCPSPALGATDHVTFVVSYDHPFGDKSRRNPKRNPFHSNRAKVKTRSLPTAKNVGPTTGQTMTYIVNHGQQPEVVSGLGRDAVNREIPIGRDDGQTHAIFHHESEAKTANRSLPKQDISCASAQLCSTLEPKSPSKVLNEQQISSIESSESTKAQKSASRDAREVDADWESSELAAYMLTHDHSKHLVSTERLDLMTTVAKATQVALPQAKASDDAAQGTEAGIEKPTDGEVLVAVSGQRLPIATVTRSLDELYTEDERVRVSSDSITYVVNYESSSLRLPKKTKDGRSKRSVSNEAVGLPFSKELQQKTDKGTQSVTYIVSHGVPDKPATANQPMSASLAETSVPIRKPPGRQETDTKLQELTIVVEHPQVNAEERKTKSSVVKPASQLATAVDQTQIDSKAESHSEPQMMISSSSVESRVRDSAESITYVVNYDEDSLKRSEKTKTERKRKKKKRKKKGGEEVSRQREAKLESPSDDVTGADDSIAGQKDAFGAETLTFVVSHSFPVSSKEFSEETATLIRPKVDLSAAEAESGKPVQQLVISVERSVETGKEGPKTSSETSLPLSIELKSASETKARAVEGASHIKLTELQRPSQSASEILTFIVNHEEPKIMTTEKKDKTNKRKAKSLTTTPDLTRGEKIFASLETDRETVRTESLTYIVEHNEKLRAKEGKHEEGEKKGRDWLQVVKKSDERFDLSTEGKTKTGSEIQNLPETCTYVVTWDYLASAAEASLWPFSKKTQSYRVERKDSDEKKMRLLRKKNQSNIASPSVPGVSVGLESKDRLHTEEFRVSKEPIGRELTAENVVESEEEKVSRKRESRLDAEAKLPGGNKPEEEEEEEETVTYIVNYDRPCASQTIQTPAPTTQRHAGTDAKQHHHHQHHHQQQQFDQCILVPLQRDGASEDGFYSATASSPPPPSPPRPSIVVAIDIGTTFSGYAFGFGAGGGPAGEEEEGTVHVMRKWEGGDPGAVDHKTPTILLLTPDGRFHSFGFGARDFYHDLSPKEANKWLYFERFKMALHCSAEGLCPSTRLAAANGQSVPAVDVFSLALRFFRDRVLQEIGDQDSTGAGGCGGDGSIVRWVITVPVSWTEEAKQFMRLSAYMAGIASPDRPDRLTIAPEPEAAGMFVRRQRLDRLGPADGGAGAAGVKASRWTQQRRAVTTTQTTDAVNQTIGSGNRYMVVDCGGGSTDISVHEIQSTGGAVRDFRCTVGAPFGSVAVDQEFEKLLVAIFGFDFIDAFKAKRPAGWVDLLMAFESRKRAANPHNAKALNVSLPFSFIDYHKKFRNCPPEVVIRNFGDDGIRWSSHGMLRLMPDAMRKLFHPAVEGITEAIAKTLKDSSGTDRGLKFLFLVGGFAESVTLQLAVRKRFGHLVKVVLPDDASISVLKGAVHLGFEGERRKSRMTYGVAVLNRFVRGQHPGSKVVARADDEWCADVFDAFVCADQPVAVGDSVVRCYALLLPGDDDAGRDDVSASAVIDVYRSEASDVRYVTDEGVTRCGTLRLSNDDDDGVRGREVQVRMTFGHREVEVTAVDLKTSKSVSFATDFHCLTADEAKRLA